MIRIFLSTGLLTLGFFLWIYGRRPRVKIIGVLFTLFALLFTLTTYRTKQETVEKGYYNNGMLMNTAPERKEKMK